MAARVDEVSEAPPHMEEAAAAAVRACDIRAYEL